LVLLHTERKGMTSAGKVLREGAMIVGPVVWIEELGMGK